MPRQSILFTLLVMMVLSAAQDACGRCVGNVDGQTLSFICMKICFTSVRQKHNISTMPKLVLFLAPATITDAGTPRSYSITWQGLKA